MRRLNLLDWAQGAAMVNMGSIVNGAFALPARSPLAIGGWALIYALPGVASWFLVRPAMLMTLEAEGAAAVDPMQYFASMLVVQLASLLVISLLLTAAFRTALRPEEPGLLGLRLGPDELRMAGLSLLLTFLFGLGFLVAAFVIGLIGIMIGPAVSDMGLALLVLLFMAASLILFAWLQVRISLAFPLTFIRRRIMIGEAWGLTRGRFWPLFGAYLVILLVMLVLWVVTGVVTSWSTLSSLMQAGMDPAAVQSVARDQMSQIGAMTVLGWLLGGLVGALGAALFAGATATAIRDLGVDRQDIAHTFA